MQENTACVYRSQVGSFLPCEADYLQRPVAGDVDNENAFEGDDADDDTLAKLAAAQPADVSRLSTADLDVPTPAGKWLKSRIGVGSTYVKTEHEYALFFALAPLCVISKTVKKKKQDGGESGVRKQVLDIDHVKLARLWNTRLLRRQTDSDSVAFKTPKHIRQFADALLKNADVAAALGSRAPLLVALRHNLKQSDASAPDAAARVDSVRTMVGGLSAAATHTSTSPEAPTGDIAPTAQTTAAAGATTGVPSAAAPTRALTADDDTEQPRKIRRKKSCSKRTAERNQCHSHLRQVCFYLRPSVPCGHRGWFCPACQPSAKCDKPGCPGLPLEGWNAPPYGRG